MTLALITYPKINFSILCICASLFVFTITSATKVLAQDTQGKLFTTAYEREYLDYLRRESQAQRANRGFDIENIPPPIIEQTTEDIVEEAPVFYILGGIIKRSGNNYSLWLNGRLLTEEQLPDNLTIEQSPNGLVLRVQNLNQMFLLKPGQTLNLNTNEIIESFQAPAQSSRPDNNSG